LYDPDTSFKDIHKAQTFLNDLRGDYWIDHVFFSWQWWVLLISTLLVAVWWWKIADRQRLREILLYGSTSMLCVSFLDVLGSELQVWDYPAMMFPWGARMISADIIIAIFFMMLYQWFENWKMFVAASAVMSAVFSFILEPLARWADFYIAYEWKGLYSFPVYIALAIFIKWAVDNVNQMSEKAD
jgi:hypothetical protein